ncbi:MAG: MFS transporter [Myxococcales bacterium]|nr:MFS transporter [Myxococcales bacterium]
MAAHASSGVARLLGANALIRVAASASGQLFAYWLAERLGHDAGVGAILGGLVGASFFVTELLGAPFAGRVADTVGQRRVLRRGPVFGAASGLVALGGTLGSTCPVGLLAALLVAARTLEGASAACAVPTTLTLLSRATEGNAARRTRVMGLFEVTSLVAMIAGFALAGLSWRAAGTVAFLALPALYAAAWLAVGSSAREPRPVAPSAQSGVADPHLPTVLATLRALARDRGSLPFAVAWLSVNAVVGAWLQHAPYVLTLPERTPGQLLSGGLESHEAGAAFVVWGLLFLAGIAAWSGLAPRAPRRRVLALGLVAMLGVAGTLALVNHGAPRALLALGALLVVVESGFTPAALAHLADLTARHDAARGTALGLYSLLLGGGQLLGHGLGAPFVALLRMDGLLILTALLSLVALLAVAHMPARAHQVPST